MSTNDASNALNFQMQSYLPNNKFDDKQHFSNSQHFNSYVSNPGKQLKHKYNLESPEESGDITMSNI